MFSGLISRWITLVTMRVPDGAGDCGSDSQGLVDGQVFLPVQLVAKRLAFDVGDDVVKETVRLARVDEGENVRVPEPGGNPDLLEESLGPDDSSKLRPE